MFAIRSEERRHFRRFALTGNDFSIQTHCFGYAVIYRVAGVIYLSNAGEIKNVFPIRAKGKLPVRLVRARIVTNKVPAKFKRLFDTIYYHLRAALWAITAAIRSAGEKGIMSSIGGKDKIVDVFPWLE